MDRIIVGTCIDYTHNGLGVVKIDKMPIFVDNLIIGEEASIKITKKEKSYCYGKVIELIKVSPNRTKPICHNYKVCGGCHLMHMIYEEQLAFKAKRVQDVLNHIGGVQIPLPKISGMDDPYRYRNKVQVPIGLSFDGQVVAGFYHPKSHQIINMDTCYLEDKQADNILHTIKKLVKKYEIEPCDTYHKIGSLRYVIIRKSYQYNEFLVVLVTRTSHLENKASFINELVQAHPSIKTIVQNINPKNTSVVLGDKEITLYGKGFIVDKINELSFNISGHSFYQINPIQTNILYSKAIEFMNLSGKETLLDAYCGVGTIGLIAATHAKKVVGVEIVKSAIKDAKQNALNNNIKNIEFVCEDATDFILKQANKNIRYDAMFFDPPRDGCSDKFLGAILKMLPKKIVYISCDPSSLARDLIKLKTRYSIDKVECVDMFPQTYHVETVVALSLKK